MELKVYSPLDDLCVCCGEHVELVHAINSTLERTPNELAEYGRIRKTISIRTLVEDNKRMRKYIQEPKIIWDEFNVCSALMSNFDIIKKLYESQGWKVSTICNNNVYKEFASSPDDEMIFEF